MREAGLFPVPEGEQDKLFESAEQISGFALTGWLVELHHGAGIWIAPRESPELEMMIPWSMVRTVITAEEKEDRLFGLPSARKNTNQLGPEFSERPKGKLL